MALPVTLADAKAQLRLLGDLTPEQTSEINDFIRDAAGWVERYTGHILEARDIVDRFTAGASGVTLRAWPIAPTATFAVTYDDQAGNPVTIPGGTLDVTCRPARIYAPNRRWSFPSADQPFRVAYRAGYENPADVPPNFRRAMLVLISAFDSDREGGEVFQAAEASARSLCRDYRNKRL